jgi:hypothetical protein
MTPIGMLLVVAFLSGSSWALISLVRRLRREHVGTRWWVAFSSLVLIGMAAGIWCAFQCRVGMDFSCGFSDNRNMTAEQVRRAREQAPFKPFTIYLSDQRRFEIPHQDFVWIVPGGRTVGIADEHGAVEIVDLVHITSLKLNGGEHT